MTTTNNKKLSPVPCRKCGLYPSTSRVMLDGLTHDKVACPKCGLSIYVQPGAAPTAVERWNAVNDRQRPRPASHKEDEIRSLEDRMGATAPYATRPSTRWYDDENYNGWGGDGYEG